MRRPEAVDISNLDPTTRSEIEFELRSFRMGMRMRKDEFVEYFSRTNDKDAKVMIDMFALLHNVEPKVLMAVAIGLGEAWGIFDDQTDLAA